MLATLKSTDADTLRIRFQKLPARWLRELLAVDAGKLFSEISTPMLLVGGEKDLQCNPPTCDATPKSRGAKRKL